MAKRKKTRPPAPKPVRTSQTFGVSAVLLGVVTLCAVLFAPEQFTRGFEQYMGDPLTQSSTHRLTEGTNRHPITLLLLGASLSLVALAIAALSWLRGEWRGWTFATAVLAAATNLWWWALPILVVGAVSGVGIEAVRRVSKRRSRPASLSS